MASTKLSKPSKLSRESAKRKLGEDASASRPKVANKKSRIVKEPSPELSSSHSEDGAEESAGDEEEEQRDEEEPILHGFSTDEDDSSDEDVDGPPIDIAKLPTVSKDDAAVKRKLEKAKKQPTVDRGVIYLGRLPHGFYEDQLKGYFTQFGDVTRLRLSRNKKTGKSKHYAFLEFESSSVAQIVSETMDNYLLMGHILRCKVIPKDEVHPELWIGANRKWRAIPRQRVARLAQNKPRTSEEQTKASKRLLKRQNNKKRKLEEIGISYNFDAVAYRKPVSAAS
ncbi:hypothetical protein GYMLUDRAFT_73349 [Collybiopsis luxurians FD-317 M1]|uniref:RRM domain-containing protein n=1 Tax=Collybiopsis luxurians FD-317 M1 TaxID=944289 RepID=A0A0D0BZJ8_9AGAR|nr:hypothetical protein GYMLUDRAFT_73349 [Collybiopsis luxurians FD-317 M1]